MGRAIDILSVLMLGAAACAFALGVDALGDQQDVLSLYWLAVGALVLRASVNILRPQRRS
jgi:hypothetical protein